MKTRKYSKREDKFSKNEFDKKESKSKFSKRIDKHCIDLEKYEFKEKKSFYNSKDIFSVKTVGEMVRFLGENKECEISAKVLFSEKGMVKRTKLNRESFLKVIKENKATEFKESFDTFSTSGFEQMGSNGGIIGHDYVPSLGGPFSKNLIYSSGWLQQAMAAFYASNHDPICKFIINTKVDFALGKGFRVDFKDKKALALWRAFEKVNKFQKTIKSCLRESLIYGETMIRDLQNNDASFYYDTKEKEKNKALIPRIFLEDPTSCWEIITRPESPNDENSRIAYVFIYPTQYQIFTNGEVPTSKFIYEQVPAKEIKHYTLNVVSNEKRGRSDLFPILGYSKRIRDSINYGLIRELKTSAFVYDVEIDGDEDDLNAYIESSEALGEIPPGGSEFVHTTKVKKELLAAPASGNVDSNTFQVCLSLCAIGSKIPFSYFATFLTGGSSRAGTIISTDPFAKHIEDLQSFCETIISDQINSFFSKINYEGGTPSFEITFPEVITQDRSSKIKDTILARDEKIFSRKRAAEIIAKEFLITDYDYNIEQELIKKEEEEFGEIDSSLFPEYDEKKSKITSEEKNKVKGLDRGD